MKKTVVISGHPDLKSSTANKRILEELENNMPGIAVRRLDELYSDYQIDVGAEQQALSQADIIVLQFPMHWYSLPALMKKWLDNVFLHGFAFGTNGDKLIGKKFILSFTTGAPEEAYSPSGAMNFNVEQFLTLLQQTAQLCSMDFVKPVYTSGMMYIAGVSSASVHEDVILKAKNHALSLLGRIKIHL